MNSKCVGRRLREIRRFKRISQTSLAAATGLGTRRNVAAIETGARTMTPQDAVATAAALGITIRHLLDPFAPPVNVQWRWRHDPDVRCE